VQRRDHVEVERVTRRAGLLGAVEHGDALGGLGQRLDEGSHGEGPIESNGDHADALALGLQPGSRLGGRLGARGHQHQHPLGLGVPGVLDQPVATPGQISKPRQHLFDDLRSLLVVAVERLTRLEESVGVLRGTPHHRPVRIQRALAMLLDQIVVDHRAELIVLEPHDLVDLVRGAEAVEEVQEGHARAQRGGLGDERHVVGLLRVGRGEHGEPAAARGVDVGVIAEDRQRMRGHCPRSDVQHAGRELAGDLVHVGQHQQQAL